LIDPKNKPLQTAWALKQKQIPGTGEISKYKACLNAYGGQQEAGVNYWDTYAPVVRWMSVQLMSVLTLANYTPNPSIFLELRMGFRLHGHDKKDLVLKLHKNLYVLKQAGYNWYKKLKKGMTDRGYQLCPSDPCIYTKDGIVVLVYVDHMLIFSRSMLTMEKFMQSLDNEYDFTDEGDIKSYLGIDVSKPQEGTY
jgi:hypothetical protein